MIPCPHGFTVCQVRWEARQVEGAQQSIHLQKVGARLAFLRDAASCLRPSLRFCSRCLGVMFALLSPL